MGAPVLAVTNLTTKGGPDAVALRGLTFSLGPGETLGFAGVDGNGQAELAGALTGLRPWTGGQVALNGREITRFRPRDRERHGIALIPPDRHTEGLALTLSIADNLTLEAARLPRFRGGLAACSWTGAGWRPLPPNWPVTSTSARPIWGFLPRRFRAATSRRSLSPAPCGASLCF